MRTLISVLSICGILASSQAASALTQKTVVKRLDKALDKKIKSSDWRIKIGSRGIIRTFSASNIKRRTKPPFLSVGSIVRGKYNTKTGKLTVSSVLHPK